MNENLKYQTIRGLKWSSLSQVARQILQYITTIILVGVLSPDDFGVMAMALIIIGFLDIFKDLGTGSALIQSKNPSGELKSSVFWVNISFGGIITILLYLIVPFIAYLYNSEEVGPILRVLSISFFIAGTSAIHKTLLEKQLSFKTLAIIEAVSTSISSALGILLAVLGYGVWSLVFQSLTNTFLNSILLWIFSKWIPSFYINYRELKALSSYSLNLIGFNVINYFSRNADYFIVGKFLGDRPLGHYYLAYRIMLYPVQNITAVVSRVLFPSFSLIQNDNSKFQNAYLKITNSIAILTFPMMTGMAFMSHEFVRQFFSSNWDLGLISFLIMILAPVGALQSIVSTVGNIYLAKGRTDWMFRWSVFSTIITVTGFFIGLRWGVIGVGVSYLITNLILLYPVFAIPFKLVDLVPSVFFRSFTNTILAVFLMLIFLYLLSYLISDLNNISKLIILFLGGAGVYVISCLRLNRKYISDFKLLFFDFNREK